MLYPALDVLGVDAGLLEAVVDDFAPTAVDVHGERTTIFFNSPGHRDDACAAVAAAWPNAGVQSREVDDEDWARRSQENLTPVTVGRITVAPRPSPGLQRPQSPVLSSLPITIVITPSMGFGTGHHATTRLCLTALQRAEIAGRRVLDVGTGSGVLAIAARALGARHVTGLDYDPDAVQAARENLQANPAFGEIELTTGDLRDVPLGAADVVTANLMGALLIQSAGLLQQAVVAGGTLIVSGLLEGERDEVVAALSTGSALAWEASEDGWLMLAFNRNGSTSV